ncbi:M3 family metallopeptidase [Sandaracinobacter sp. RS1-74]|uniref:M3 family metallopeptidase n=1 Tax=Sandaracinobacteroides sayramensis TaxID=2913411 RepID=UPI001EDBBD9D|nr:M3 family metallopeptidase [Sandaracinobacteroides sayramensis]MCG2842404.1 M3 family metallopeptidase [Sandaracinobacteroides sayramensis]
MKSLLLASALLLAVPAAAADAAQAPADAQQMPFLLQPWTGPHGGVPPWDKVKPEMFPPAFTVAADKLRAETRAIAGNKAVPTFDNVIGAMQASGEDLNRVSSLFNVMTSNMNSAEYQSLSREWRPKLAALSDEISLDPKLFARIDALYARRASQKLSPTQLRLLERTHADFVRSGAKLNAADKAKLSAFNQELAKLFTEFNEKLLKDEETAISVTEAELKGVPDGVRSAARAAAEERKLPGYAIVNTRSAVDPILTFADDRAVREKVWRAFVNRGDNGDANDTNATIARIVKLRADRAKLLGYPTHANLRMADTMAVDPARAEALMLRVWGPAVARVGEEVADMQKIAGHAIEPWDYLYFAEKVRKERFDLSAAETKPYFELNNMIEASYYAANRLYGLNFKEVTGTVPVFHPDVRVYEVTGPDGRHVGLFYRDDFARTGKRSGAWHTTYRLQRKFPTVQTVINSNNNNFAKPSAGEPVLISYDDAETLFHEFGHAIHFLLQDVTYPGLAYTPRDFIEYPSQVNENWLLTRDVLDKYARHYQTKAPMPAALVEKIEKSQTFNQGYATVSYLSSAIVDMKLHTLADGVVDPDRFERETLAAIGMPKEIVMRHRLPQFSHLFSGDSYSAGYYSYLWSETMDGDTWAAFQESGSVWDKGVADRFRTILLSTGNETDRAEAYRQFRGRDAEVGALLKKRGFPAEAQ